MFLLFQESCNVSFIHVCMSICSSQTSSKPQHMYNHERCCHNHMAGRFVYVYMKVYVRVQMHSLAAILSQPPPPSLRPPVTGYKILHNITGVIMANQTIDTNFRVDSLEAGIYLFTVLAVNILGDGAETSTLLAITGFITLYVCILFSDKITSLIHDYVCTI